MANKVQRLWRKIASNVYKRVYPETHIDAVLYNDYGKTLHEKLDDMDGDLSTHNTDPTAHANLYIHAGQKSGTVLGQHSTAEGRENTSSADSTHTEGWSNTASGEYAHAEGSQNTVTSISSHAEGQANTVNGVVSHAEGRANVVHGWLSHVEGYMNVAGRAEGTAIWGAHAEGYYNVIEGGYSHAEGTNNYIAGATAHAEGTANEVHGECAHAEGYGNKATHRAQHVFGMNNVADPSTAAGTDRGTYVEIVGNGTSNNARSNARTLDWSGNEWLAGKLTLGAGPTANMDAVTKQYADSIDGSTIKVEVPTYVSILNTDSPILGDKTVYFRDYPDIKWQVQHIDGDYVYLALTGNVKGVVFGANATYSTSAIASACNTYLNNTIPKVAQYLEDVTIEGVTAKVFIPSKAMYDTEWDYPKQGASQRATAIDNWSSVNSSIWTSTKYNNDSLRLMSYDGYTITIGSASDTFGFRPAVKVNYKRLIHGTVTRTLNSAIETIGGTVIVDYDSNAEEAFAIINSAYQLGKAVYVRYKSYSSSSSYTPYYLALVDGPAAESLDTTTYIFRAIHNGSEYVVALTNSGQSYEWSNSISDFLKTSGGTMTGELSMSSHRITNLATPSRDSDAVTKKYVDDTIGNMITAVFDVGSTPPDDTRLLWIDPNSDSGGLKYYDGSSWRHVPVAYTSMDSISDLSGTNMTGTSALTAILGYGTNPPDDTRLLWVDTTPSTGGLKYYNGTAWVNVPVAYVEE